MNNFVVEDIKNTFKSGNYLAQIILANVILFLLVNIINHLLLIPFFGAHGDELVKWLALPADLSSFIVKIWTILTYMFLHTGFWHILFNMLWLYWMGKILTEYLGNRKFMSAYVLGGFTGGALFIIVYNIAVLAGSSLLSLNDYLLGASAGVMAVVFAAATLLPNFQIGLLFIGPVKLKYIALGAFILTTLIDFTENTGGKIAHMGGAFFGYIYVKELQKGRDISRGFNRFINTIATYFSKKPKIKVVHRRPKSNYEYNTDKAKKQKKMDSILDKISKSGYDSLSKEEKEFLFKMSNDQ